MKFHLRNHHGPHNERTILDDSSHPAMMNPTTKKRADYKRRRNNCAIKFAKWNRKSERSDGYATTRNETMTTTTTTTTLPTDTSKVTTVSVSASTKPAKTLEESTLAASSTGATATSDSITTQPTDTRPTDANTSTTKPTDDADATTTKPTKESEPLVTNPTDSSGITESPDEPDFEGFNSSGYYGKSVSSLFTTIFLVFALGFAL
mmetsp:Transcript_18886/g.39757  ORF Transcript_18886/g.39757 Transcript_18886/m.39757 type:complete len:206 (-) Transcript_18886:617-1234(-)